MSLETTSTPLGNSQTDIRESEDTPKGSLSFRPLPAPLVCLLATTPVAGFSAYDLFARDFVSARDTISMDEENDLAALSIGSEIEEGYKEQTLRSSEAEAANRTRLELLARQYVSKHLSPEEDARLSIVTEKVRRLIPRVTVEDFEALGRIAEQLNRIGSEDTDRRRRLGIA
jgi:hypothetical protein